MERLTKKLGNKGTVVFTQGKYEETILAEMTVNETRIVLRKLADYEDLEEQGLMVRLPAKIGSTVYRINPGSSEPIIDMKVVQIDIIENSYNIWIIDRDYGEIVYSEERIGKDAFFTREEAEKRLEELQNDKA